MEIESGVGPGPSGVRAPVPARRPVGGSGGGAWDAGPSIPNPPRGGSSGSAPRGVPSPDAGNATAAAVGSRGVGTTARNGAADAVRRYRRLAAKFETARSAVPRGQTVEESPALAASRAYVGRVVKRIRTLERFLANPDATIRCRLAQRLVGIAHPGNV